MEEVRVVYDECVLLFFLLLLYRDKTVLIVEDLNESLLKTLFSVV